MKSPLTNFFTAAIATVLFAVVARPAVAQGPTAPVPATPPPTAEEVESGSSFDFGKFLNGPAAGELSKLLGEKDLPLLSRLSKEFNNLSDAELQQWLNNPETAAAALMERGEAAFKSGFRESKEVLDTPAGHALLMQKPDFIVTGERFSGDPVWYVNGILTTKESARTSGEALAATLKRPVYVIHNPSHSEAPARHTGLEAERFGTDDLSECVYDRMWPGTITANLRGLDADAVADLVERKEMLQANPATRQLAYVLYHSRKPVNLVTHSQGCMIARNACLTMLLLGKEERVSDNLAWVAFGSPLNAKEVWPQPEKFTTINTDNDPVPRLLGLSNPATRLEDCDFDQHDFCKCYVPLIKADMLHRGGNEF